MRPAWPLITCLVLWGLSGLAVVFVDLSPQVWGGLGLAIGALAALDAIRLRWQPSPTVSRQMPEIWPLNVNHDVGLRLHASRSQSVDVFDLYPGHWQMQGLPQRLRLRRGRVTAFHYRLCPTERGDAVFAGIQIRLHSPWRLWWQSRQLEPARKVRVYPNFAPLTRFALFSAEQASRLVGAHLKRRRGEGTDFNQMREYRTGDSLRQIDWKATARVRKLISREYQDEKNQPLVLLMDTGRRMLARESGLAHFDHALNAALVVAYLALRQGDAVGLAASGGEQRWIPPRRSMGTIDALLRASYNVQPQPVATDYLAMANNVLLHQRRRSLIMLMTNVRDESIDDLLMAVRLLQKRHLVCVASLRERELDQALSAPVLDLPAAIQAGAIARYLEERSRAHDQLRHHRVMVLDVTCEDLPAALVERYLAIKRAGLL